MKIRLFKVTWHAQWLPILFYIGHTTCWKLIWHMVVRYHLPNLTYESYLTSQWISRTVWHIIMLDIVCINYLNEFRVMSHLDLTHDNWWPPNHSSKKLVPPTPHPSSHTTLVELNFKVRFPAYMKICWLLCFNQSLFSWSITYPLQSNKNKLILNVVITKSILANDITDCNWK